MASQNFWGLASSQQVAKNALLIAAVVGTILALINYGDKFLLGTMQPLDWLKLSLTYFVPYAVSTFSAVRAIQAQRN